MEALIVLAVLVALVVLVVVKSVAWCRRPRPR